MTFLEQFRGLTVSEHADMIRVLNQVNELNDLQRLAIAMSAFQSVTDQAYAREVSNAADTICLHADGFGEDFKGVAI